MRSVILGIVLYTVLDTFVPHTSICFSWFSSSDKIILFLENVMFHTSQKDSELRLIDFGSGTIDGVEDAASSAELDEHHTFAGSALYISPEMFQRTYTSETDVWSTAVTLYVLVACYPVFFFRHTVFILPFSSSPSGTCLWLDIQQTKCRQPLIFSSPIQRRQVRTVDRGGEPVCFQTCRIN